MAERRMFAKTIIDSDAFLEMPQSTQLLYFHLSMRGDDDGFINKPKTIMRMVGCKEDDLKILIGKKFIIPFESGVVVVKHWRIHNYIQNDRYNETKYKSEKAMLVLDENKAYRLTNQIAELETKSDVYIVDTHNADTQNVDAQVRLGKDSIGKSIKSSHFVSPSFEEVQAYCKERNNCIDAEKFIDHYTANGWVQGKGKPIKDWKAAVRTWEKNDFNKGNSAQQTKPNKFNQFPQRQYTDQEMTELEKKLLNKNL